MVMNKKTYFIFTIAVFCAFIFITLKATFFSGRGCWEDEAHFWTIIQNVTIPELFRLMKVEGHMLLWYLVVMPFAKLNFPYPYPMQILNWLFCVGALAIMWKKADFNPLIKAMIVLSPVFMGLYAVHARCYSIGVFFLFGACALYKKRLNYPYIYFLILWLAANTSVQGLIGATALGLVFLFDLIKDAKIDKTKLKIPVIITALTALTGLMFYFQLIGAATPDYEIASKDLNKSENFILMFWGIIPITKALFYKIIGLRIAAFAFLGIFATKPRALFVYAFPMLISSYFFATAYYPRYWHLAFFFIYLIIACWIFAIENKNEKINKIFITVFYTFLFCFLTVKIQPPAEFDVLSPTFIKNSEFKNAKTFSNIDPITLSVILPKINPNGIYIYDLHGRKLNSYEGLNVIFNKEAKNYVPQDLKNNIDLTKRNFLITYDDLEKNDLFPTIKKKIFIKGSRKGQKYYVYEIFKD